MKKARLILTASMLTLAGFATITMSSCGKDEVCPIGYAGKDCKTLVRDGFVGQWTGSDICTSGQYDIDLSVNPSSTSEVKALITNAGGFGSSVTISGTVTAANTLEFASQDVGGDRTLSGTMIFSNNTMSFSYEVVGLLSTDNCNGTYTKQ